MERIDHTGATRRLKTSDIHLDITPATQYAAAFVDGKCVAHARRRRVLDKTSPVWTVYRPNQDRVWFTETWGHMVRHGIARRLNAGE